MAEALDRSRPPAVGEGSAPGLPPVERSALAPGLDLAAVRVPGAPLVILETVVGAGSALDPPAAAGLADLTANLLPEGAAGLGMLEIAERVDALGARLSVGTVHDAAWLRLVVVTANVGPALDLLADLVVRASFPPAEVERVRAERAVDLQQERDDPSIVAGRAFAAELYGSDHPYGRSRRGTPETVAALDREAFRAFHVRAWRPGGATLIAAGDLDPAALRGRAESALADWPAGTPPSVDVGPPGEPGHGVVLLDRPGSAQSVLRVGHLGVARAHPDHDALEVLNHLLGGAFTSRLNLELRERRGWTYGVRSSFSFRRGAGPFLVATQVDTTVTAPAVERIQAEVARAAAGPVEESERSLAVHGLTRSLPLRFESASQIAARMRELVVFGLPDDWWSGYAGRLRAVTVEDLERAAAKHLQADRLLAVVVGDAERTAAALEAIGPVRRRPWKPAAGTAAAD